MPARETSKACSLCRAPDSIVEVKRLDYRDPFLPGDDFVHDFQEFVPFVLPLAIRAFYVGESLLLHLLRPLPFWVIIPCHFLGRWAINQQLLKCRENSWQFRFCEPVIADMASVPPVRGCFPIASFWDKRRGYASCGQALKDKTQAQFIIASASACRFVNHCALRPAAHCKSHIQGKLCAAFSVHGIGGIL
jgi:hypothetical protein